jgi:two-component system chemotaxis response regulator CheB
MAHRDIVVVGASAGGVEALQVFVAGLPASLQASVFIVLHIPADAPSRLHEILERVSALPVEPARDGGAIVPGHIYTAVPDRHLLLEANRIRLTRGPKENRTRPAVDVLFRSAAYHFGPRVIGVVLSGNLDDGTAGLWTVKDRGGVALVQSPREAFAPSMPQSAIAHVEVDCILPITQIPQAIVWFSRETVAAAPQPVMGTAMETELKIAEGSNSLTSGSLELGQISPNTCPVCHGVLIQIEEGSITRYRCHTGHAFSIQTLFAQVNEEIDDTLVAAQRALNERILLLAQLERQARAAGNQALADLHVRQMEASLQWSQQLREMVNGGDQRQSKTGSG